MNTVILFGRLGQNPELKTLPSGDSVVNFSLATSKRWTDKEGNKQESTQWHNLKAFKQKAELIAKYCNKGECHAFIGSLVYSNYEKDGVKYYKTEIEVKEIEFLNNKKQETDNSVAETPNYAPPIDDVKDDGLPF